MGKRFRQIGRPGHVFRLAALVLALIGFTGPALAANSPITGLNQFARFYDNLPKPMLLIEPVSGQIEFANQAAIEFYGYTQAQITRLSIQDINLLTSAQVAQERQRAIREDRNYFIFQHQLADGSARTVEVTSVPIHLDGRKLLYSTIKDISEERNDNAGLWHYQSRLEEAVAHARGQLEQQYANQRIGFLAAAAVLALLLSAVGFYARQLRLSRNALREANKNLLLADQVFENASEGILVTDPDGIIVRANPAVSQISGYPMEEIIGNNPRIFSSGRQSTAFYTEMWQSLITTGSWMGDLWNRKKNGEEYAQKVALSAIRDEQGDTSNYLAVFSDITALVNHQKELEQTAHFDALTELPNRALLLERMHEAIDLVASNDDWGAVLFLDLDGFKEINDLYGHSVGDSLLIAASRRVATHFRPEDTLGRLGGDEFAAIVTGLTTRDQALELANRILGEIAKPFEFDGLRVSLSTSIGITTFCGRSEVTPDLLLRQSDTAMYQSKLEGKNRYTLFNPKTEVAITSFNNKINALSAAIDQEELLFHFQPKVDVVRGAIHGVEALVRWDHPQDGLRMPNTFLEATENLETALKLDGWALARSFETLSSWKERGVTTPLSVNIDPRNLASGWIYDHLRDLLRRYENVDPAMLDIEVLESADAIRGKQVSEAILACKKLGVTFSIDDFGTGYSTLTHLRHLPADHVKIDQSFVRHSTNSLDDLAIVDAVLGLATALNREVIAEGVETKDHQNLLISLGCPLLQGYSIARPMPEQDYFSWQAKFQPDPDWDLLMTLSKRHARLLYYQVDLRNWVETLKAAEKNGTPYPCTTGARNLREIYWPWLNREGGLLFAATPLYASLIQHSRNLLETTNTCGSRQAPGRHVCDPGDIYRIQDLALRCIATIDRIILQQPAALEHAPAHVRVKL